MKLIRLTTEDENAIFDNIFNEDIILKPNSRICLQAMTTQLNKDVMIVNSSNNKIEFTLDGAIPGDDDYYTIYLNVGTYDSSNIEDFFTDFTNKLNYAMTGNTPATLGKNWLVALNGNRTNIICKRGEVLTLTNGQVNTKYLLRENCVIQNNNSELAYLQRDAGTVNTYDSFFYSIGPCGKGPSSLRAQLREDVDTNAGFFLCYTGSPPKDGIDSIIVNNDIMYGIKYVGQTTPYAIWYNGTQIPSTSVTQVMPSIAGTGNPLNDILCIDIAQELVTFYIMRGYIKTILYETPNDIAVPNLFALGICIGNTQVWNLENTLDPFYVITNKAIRYRKSPLVPNSGVVIATEPLDSQTYFKIDSTELATQLGYITNVFPPQLFPPLLTYTLQDDVSILAKYAFFLKFNSDSYIVELLNLKIDSMDSMSKQHKNFLAVIPNDTQIVERVSYIAPVLLWIDLNNRDNLNLRQLKARIIREDLSPIFCYGLSQLVLLIE
jgi:hypothetical protein